MERNLMFLYTPARQVGEPYTVETFEQIGDDTHHGIPQYESLGTDEYTTETDALNSMKGRTW